MRIAPKPVPGQEISLDSLLKDRPKPEPPEPEGKSGISQTQTRWIFQSVDTLSGNVRLEIWKDTGDPIRLSEVKTFPFTRLISADEFYGVMMAAYNASHYFKDDCQDAEDFSKWISDLWTSEPKVPFLTDTRLRFSNKKSGEVIHRQGAHDEEIKLYFRHTDYRIDSENVNQIFGAPNLATLELALGGNNLSRFDIKLPQNQIQGAGLNLYLHPESLELVPQDLMQLGRPILVKTLKNPETP